jgi:two-component system OmpR family response regulator
VVRSLVVPRGRVLVIEADEWLGTLVSKFLADAGYSTQAATTARSGFDQAIDSLPDGVLCDVVLPDIDGFWVTRRIRADKSKLAGTPILLLSQKEDHTARLEGLALGADVFLTPPFRYEEVIAQVDALLGMAHRLSARRDSSQSDGPVTGPEAAVNGDLAHISVPTFLTMLEMEHRTGRVHVRARGKASVVIELVEGNIVRTRAGNTDIDPVELIRDVVTWNKGKYTFEPSRIEAGPTGRRRIGPLLMEAFRLNDEANQGSH